MTAYERVIIRTRQALLGVDTRAAGALTDLYTDVTVRLAGDLQALTARVEDARAAGEPMRPTWLHRQDRYTQLLRQLEQALAEFAGTATAVIESSQRAATILARVDAQDLTIAALGPAPDPAQTVIRGLFQALPAAALDAFVGRSMDGTPLGLLLLELAPDGVQRVRATLATAIALGQSPREITTAVAKDTDTTLARALTLSRTEILGAYRQATDVVYEQSDAITGWEWYAAVNERTCMVCLAMHGTRHSLDEPLASHPACRCTKLPVTRTWAELGFPDLDTTAPRLETGEDAFARLTRPEKHAIVGTERLRLLDEGTVTLQDLVTTTHSKRWGPGRKPRPLADLTT